MPTGQLIEAIALIALSVALAAAGITISELDDALGAALAGIVLMIVLIVLGVRSARRKA